jgi:hypothetical protein
LAQTGSIAIALEVTTVRVRLTVEVESQDVPGAVATLRAAADHMEEEGSEVGDTSAGLSTDGRDRFHLEVTALEDDGATICFAVVVPGHSPEAALADVVQLSDAVDGEGGRARRGLVVSTGVLPGTRAVDYADLLRRVEAEGHVWREATTGLARQLAASAGAELPRDADVAVDDGKPFSSVTLTPEQTVDYGVWWAEDGPVLCVPAGIFRWCFCGRGVL